MQSAVTRLLADEARAQLPPAPRAPSHLDKQAKAKWREVVVVLQLRGDDLDAGTLDALAAYCVAWSQWLAAQAQVATLGLVVKSPAGFPAENPYLTVARKAQAALRQWGEVLGITPKSRRRATS